MAVYLLSLLLLAGSPLPVTPAAVQFRPDAPNNYALVNARIVTVTGSVIEGGTILISGGRITAVGTGIAVPPGATVVDCSNLSVYPGMIDSGTTLGLSEVGSDERTQDYNEVGDLTPQAEALTAVNPSSTLIPVTRISGVTTVLTEPSGGLFPGTAAVVNLHGYTPNQMLVPGGRVMKLSFPSTGRRGRFDRRSDEDIKKADEKAKKRLNEIWDQAELYARIDSAYTANPKRNTKPEYNPEIRALIPAVRGTMSLMISVNRAKDIQSALQWVKERKLEHVVFSGVSEGWRVADEIAAAGIPCLVGPVLALPPRDSDRYDKAYKNAGLLHAAGVKIAIRTNDDNGNFRNLPYHAGFAAAYGLGAEEALKAVTINAAEIFGVADEIGSIEVGKQANLVVTDGDPFETKTQVKHVFIEGYEIPLESRQTRLYDEFLNRNPGLTKEMN